MECSTNNNIRREEKIEYNTPEEKEAVLKSLLCFGKMDKEEIIRWKRTLFKMWSQQARSMEDT